MCKGVKMERKTNGYAPTDWQLASMVKFLWKNKFLTTSWNVNHLNSFINLKHEKNMINFFQFRLKEKNIMLIDRTNISYKQIIKLKDYNNDKHPDKIKIYYSYNETYFYQLEFNSSLIKLINDSFKISNQKPKKIYKGRIINI